MIPGQVALASCKDQKNVFCRWSSHLSRSTSEDRQASSIYTAHPIIPHNPSSTPPHQSYPNHTQILKNPIQDTPSIILHPLQIRCLCRKATGRQHRSHPPNTRRPPIDPQTPRRPPRPRRTEEGAHRCGAQLGALLERPLRGARRSSRPRGEGHGSRGSRVGRKVWVAWSKTCGVESFWIQRERRKLEQRETRFGIKMLRK